MWGYEPFSEPNTFTIGVFCWVSLRLAFCDRERLACLHEIHCLFPHYSVIFCAAG